MKTLIEKIEDAFILTKKVMAENPEVTGLWYEFGNVPMEQLRDAADQYGYKVEYSKELRMMRLHVSEFDSTIFCHSAVVRVTEHIVVDEAIENV